MKKVDFALTRALLKKQWLERIYRYRRGRFDVLGFAFSAVLLCAIVTLFVVFFGRFIGLYTGIKTDNALDVPQRVYELLTIVYSILIVFLTVGAVGQINGQIFDADDVRLFSAMPVDATSQYLAKLITIYLSQLVISTVAVLAVNLTLAFSVQQSWQFYLMTVIACFTLPLITIALASLVALPVHLVRRFFKNRFVVKFLFVTAVVGVMFYLYSIVLSAVEQMLNGNDLRYFFSSAIMETIGKVVSVLYPTRWIVDLMMARNALVASLCIVAVLIVCLTASLIIIRFILQRALQLRNQGVGTYQRKTGKITDSTNDFFALVKKDFLLIFRTSSYMFSYLSVAVLMPLMVYFCMTVGGSLVYRLVGLSVNLELALFLTLLFGALTNVFCATNISRDGEMFYTIKVYPISYKKVFFSKIFLCLLVTAASQLISAVLLSATGNISWYGAIFLFIVGTAFGFVNICVATRHDFNHAHFSTEEDGEIKESSGVVSSIIIFGMVVSFIVGGFVLTIRIITALRQQPFEWLTYVIALVAAAVSSALAFFYFIGNLGEKYYQFEGDV
ncbi:MAG: hypothetical protein J1F66_02545 [Clostridiales bacterium]|nr:hypothetical protein [Clostridiales bacterium]